MPVWQCGHENLDLMVLKRLVLYGEHTFTGARLSSSAGTGHLLGPLGCWPDSCPVWHVHGHLDNLWTG